jgi:hypothetical protein
MAKFKAAVVVAGLEIQAGDTVAVMFRNAPYVSNVHPGTGMPVMTVSHRSGTFVAQVENFVIVRHTESEHHDQIIAYPVEDIILSKLTDGVRVVHNPLLVTGD